MNKGGTRVERVPAAGDHRGQRRHQHLPGVHPQLEGDGALSSLRAGAATYRAEIFTDESGFTEPVTISLVEGNGFPSSKGSGCRGESGQRDEVGLAGGEPRHLLDAHDESGRGGGAET